MARPPQGRRRRNGQRDREAEQNDQPYDNGKSRMILGWKVPKYVINIVVILALIGVIFLLWHQFGDNDKLSTLGMLHPFRRGEVQYMGEVYGKTTFLNLPKEVHCISYKLNLQINLTDELYSGTVKMRLNVIERPDIILHSRNLIIENVELENNKNRKVAIQNILHPVDKRDNLLKEHLLIKKEAPYNLTGEYNLKINFKGHLNNLDMGIYKTQYSNENEEESRKIISSRFEPTFARRAFPCFDEPYFKSNFSFQVDILGNESYTILSNSPILFENKTENRVSVQFQETRPISTYQFALIVGNFNSTTKYFRNKYGEFNKVSINVYARPELLDWTNFASDIAVTIMEFYLDYFGVACPLSKLDLVAIPGMVKRTIVGAGLTSFGEAVLLYNEQDHSSESKQEVATIIARELANSWFGNLVTMSWWDNLWLTKGFMSFMKYKAVDKAEPGWKMMDQFLIEELHPALAMDDNEFSHSILNTVTSHPDLIQANFDEISYNKAASVLRMIENVIGTNYFQNVSRDLLSKFAYGTVEYKDFIEVIEEYVSDENIIEFINTFMYQTGYPVVTVRYSDDGRNNFILTQKRFLKNTNVKSNTKWKIPIRYRFIGEHNESEIHWFNQTEENIIIKVPPGKVIKFNPNQVGYYRVNYPAPHWILLMENFNKFSIADKVHLLEESFSLSEASQLPYDIPLGFTKYLISQKNYLMWKVVKPKLLAFAKFSNFFLVEYFVKKLLENDYKTFTWEAKPDDGHLDKLTRSEVLDIACSFYVRECLENANETFLNWLAHNETISPDQKGIVYKYGMQQFDNLESIKYLVDMSFNVTDIHEKLQLLKGLANIHNTTLLNDTISYLWDGQYYEREEYIYFLEHVATNSHGVILAWKQVTDNWNTLVNHHNVIALSRIIRKIARSFKRGYELQDMTSFLNQKYKEGITNNILNHALDIVKTNMEWITKFKEAIDRWLTVYRRSNPLPGFHG